MTSLTAQDEEGKAQYEAMDPAERAEEESAQAKVERDSIPALQGSDMGALKEGAEDKEPMHGYMMDAADEFEGSDERMSEAEIVAATSPLMLGCVLDATGPCPHLSAWSTLSWVP